MEKKIEATTEKKNVDMKETKISRKEAIKRTGYIAISAATMMVLLSSPSQAQGSAPAPPPKGPSKQGGGGIWKK
jgi:hypothetical protein